MKWALGSESAQRINALLDLAQSEPGIPVLADDLDRDPWLLNCPNGTLDLRSGHLREHRPEDLLTKLCPTVYQAQASCPTWERFLATVFEDEALIAFVQRLFGYCLTGDVREQILPIFWGPGANGKTTLLTTVQEVLGSDYALTANEDLLVKRRGERHPTEVAQLFKIRLVVAEETEEGAALNEKRVKALTGGGRLRGRGMRQDFWEFASTHKVILVTNHKPTIRGRDPAIWRRLRLVPFEKVFWNPDEAPAQGQGLPPELKQDKDLPQKLAAEREGTLAWMVRGCLDWQRQGLTAPAKVMEATKAYREAEDVVAQFLQECCHLGSPDYRIRAGALYEAFKGWLARSGQEEMSHRTFGEDVGSRPGITKKQSNGTWYHGIILRQTDSAE